MNFVAIAGLAAFTMTSCAAENPETETPFPLSPRTALEEAMQSQNTPQTKSKSPASPTSIVQRPSLSCIVMATRTEQVNGDEISPGAVIRLEPNDSLIDSVLVYRVQPTSRTPGSFFWVNDMVFGDEGTHGSGTYTFELQTADGRACDVAVTVTSDDISQKSLIKVNAIFPD